MTRTAESYRHLQNALRAAPLFIVAFDSAGVITSSSGSRSAFEAPMAERLVGLSVQELCRENSTILDALSSCLSGEQVDVVTRWAGRTWALHYRCQSNKMGTVIGGLCIAEDTTPRPEQGAAGPAWGRPSTRDHRSPSSSLPAKLLRNFQERDEATGLRSRRGMHRILSDPLAPASTRCVVMLDVDSFELVNVMHGQEVGDEVLRQLAGRISAVMGHARTGRWESDQFICVIDASDAAPLGEALTTQVLRAVREPMHLDAECLHLTMSAGIVSSAQVGQGDLPQLATEALREAKKAGPDRWAWFDPSLRPTTIKGIRLASDLRRGIAADELRLHYQPIMEVASSRLTGFEALVRWQHPEFGLLAPGHFIELAERIGQMVTVGAWVTEQACRTLMDLGPLAAGRPSMSVNLSARQLDDENIVELLAQALHLSGCPPERLTVEVTETALMRDITAATRTLQRIKELGVSMALDDFGTGYSSLLYLKQFPVDLIKIDKSFVQGLGTEADDTAIVASTVSLAHSIGVRCVAEGVETVSQLDLLRRVGCDYAQGYLFSRPLTRLQLDQWLQVHSPVKLNTTADPASTRSDINEIMRLHSEGASLHTVAAALNVRGLRTELGVRWSAKSVAKAITLSQFPDIILPRHS